jgi:hypothetical protein
MNVRHRMPFVSAVITAAFLGLACGRESRNVQSLPATNDVTNPPIADAASHVALLRVVNAVPAEPATDVMIGDQIAFSQVAYGAVTPYREFTTEAVTFRLRPSVPDDASLMAETTERLNAGKHYTLLAMPNDPGGASLALLVDEVAPPAEGKAALRLMNASPEPGKVDVDVRGSTQALVSGPAGSSASGFVDVAPLNGTLVVHRSRAVLARVRDAHLESGRRYTLLLLGAAQSPAGGHEARLIDEPYPGSPQS